MIKSKWPLCLAGACTLLVGTVSHGQEPDSPRPAAVTRSIPAGASSFLLERLQNEGKEGDFFVHVWGAPRPNTSDSLNRYNRFTYSPFCVDIFSVRPAANGEAIWRLVTSAVYGATDPPLSIKAHWLHPADKRGHVFDIISNNGAPGLSTIHTVMVWDKGFEESNAPPVPQTFVSGGLGGGTLQQDFEGVDERGYLIIRSIDSFAGQVKSTQTFKWNGARFSAG